MVKIGIMSDTHDNLNATEDAVEFLNEKGVNHVVHAGDLVSPFVVGILSKLEAELHFVWGNNEGDRNHVRQKFEEIDVEPKDFESLEIGGCKVALIHGEEEEIVKALAESDDYDVVVRGHTHDPGVSEDPMVINPGPASGYLAESRTVALMDTEEMSAEILEF